MSDTPVVVFSETAALPDWSAFQRNSYLARVDWPHKSVVVKLPTNARQESQSFWRDSVVQAAEAAAVEGKSIAEVTEWPRPVLWRDVFGRPVDVENIDRAYALNILQMYVARKAAKGWRAEDFRQDELTSKLRETILNGRDPNEEDNERAREYNKRCAAEGLSLRAPVTDDGEDSLKGPGGLY